MGGLYQYLRRPTMFSEAYLPQNSPRWALGFGSVVDVDFNAWFRANTGAEFTWLVRVQCNS